MTRKDTTKKEKSTPLPFRSQKQKSSNRLDVLKGSPSPSSSFSSMPLSIKKEESDDDDDENSHQISPSFSAFCDSFRFIDTSSQAPQRILRSSIKREVAPIDVDKDREPMAKRIKEEEKSFTSSPDTNWKTTKILPEVPDHVRDGMDVLMIGSNPGRMSSVKCQHFGHPSNHFYRALHRSGFTSRLYHPSEDYTMLNQQSPFLTLGLTNLAARPTRMAHELDKTENELGALILTDLIRKHRPRVGTFIGIGVGKAYEQAIFKAKRKNEIARQQNYITIDVPNEVPLVSDRELGLGVGLMPLGVRHIKDEKEEKDRPDYTLLFACPSTSGRVTSHQLPQKSDCMKRARILTEYTFPNVQERNPSLSISTKSVQIELI